MEAAESIITLLAQLNVSKFPWEERIGLAVCQTKAMRQWIEADSFRKGPFEISATVPSGAGGAASEGFSADVAEQIPGG